MHSKKGKLLMSETAKRVSVCFRNFDVTCETIVYKMLLFHSEHVETKYFSFPMQNILICCR